MSRLRTATTLLALTAALAGCGSPGGGSAQAPPVFVEPSVASTVGPTSATTNSPTPTATTPASAKPSAKASAKATPSASRKAGPYRYVFPVKAGNVAFHPTHGKYPATDIFADCGEPVVAAIDGRILEVSRKDRYVEGRPDGPYNGGLSVSLLGDDGVRYYGSHLSRIHAGIAAGVRVSAGERLGDVGRTGNANNVCHLHFGISPPCAMTGDWKVRRGVVWPAPFLTSWRGKGAKSPVATVTAWKKSHNCKA